MLISLAQRCRGGEAGDSNQLAPARLPAFLAVDVTRGPVLGGLHHACEVVELNDETENVIERPQAVLL